MAKVLKVGGETMIQEQGTVVRHKESGLRGVIVEDQFGCCSDDETPVVFEGTKHFIGTADDLLEVVGPEQAVPIPSKCGMGKGESCCIFLVSAGSEFQCQRFGRLRNQLMFTSMKAKREPHEMFPDCMNQ